jgi:hypothetical protein
VGDIVEPSASRHKQFVSEPITPVAAAFDAARMSQGEPGVPDRFIWRGEEYQVARVVESWKTTGPCRHGSREQYVRRHWFTVDTTDGHRMDIYFDRQPRTGHKKQRWWLASIATTG